MNISELVGLMLEITTMLDLIANGPLDRRVRRLTGADS